MQFYLGDRMLQSDIYPLEAIATDNFAFVPIKETNKRYTVMMFDSSAENYLHFLAVNVLSKKYTPNGDVIFTYLPPQMPNHNYHFMVFRQTMKIDTSQLADMNRVDFTASLEGFGLIPDIDSSVDISTNSISANSKNDFYRGEGALSDWDGGYPLKI